MSIIEKAIRRTVEAEAARAVTAVPASRASGQTFAAMVRGKAFVDLRSESLRAAGFVVAEGKARMRRNEFRSIKSPVLAAAATHEQSNPTQRTSAVAVLSSLPGEGKSYVSFNLASSLAMEYDVATVLIDGDVARHQLSSLLGVHDRPGLSDYLSSEQVSLADVLLPTVEPSVFFIPSGKWREDVSELIASARMRALLENLVQPSGRTIAVLDCPPLLVTSESAALMKVADQLLFVVRANYSQQKTVEDAASKLDRGKTIHVVLNAWQPLSISERAYYAKYQDYYGSKG
jgi:protein-tyrosine kinase